jgi:hypothetical protein
VWRVISSAHNLITVVQKVRRKLHTTLNNICMVLTLTGIELWDSICDVNVSTVPTRFSIISNNAYKNELDFIMETSEINGYEKSSIQKLWKKHRKKQSLTKRKIIWSFLMFQN